MQPIYQQFQQHLKSGDRDSARQLIRQYIKDHPDDADGWYLAATVAGKQQQVNLLNRALAIDPYHEKAHRALAQMQSAPAEKVEKASLPPRSRHNLIFGILLIIIILSGLWVGTRYFGKAQPSLSFEEQMEALKDYLYNPNIPSIKIERYFSSLNRPYAYDPERGFSEGSTYSGQFLYVQGVIRNMTNFMREADDLNPIPNDNEEWILINITSECLRNTFCRAFTPYDFLLINRRERSTYQIPTPTQAGFFGIDEINLLKMERTEKHEFREGLLAFIVPKNTSTRDLVLVYSPYDLTAIYHASSEAGNTLPWTEWVNYLNNEDSSYFELVDILLE